MIHMFSLLACASAMKTRRKRECTSTQVSSGVRLDLNCRQCSIRLESNNRLWFIYFLPFSSQLWFSSSLPSLPIPCFSRFLSQYFWLDWFLSNNSPLPVYSQAHTRIDSTTHSYRRFHNPHLHSCSAVIRIPSSGSRISSKSSSSSLLSLLSSSSWSAYAPEHYHLFDQCWCGSGQLMNQFTLRREFSRFLPVMDLVSWKPRSITSRGKKERLRSRFYSTGPNKAGVH